MTKTSSDELQLKNPQISGDKEDILYHLSLGNKTHNLAEMFGDVKFVCLGDTPHRMEKFANYIMQEIGYKLSTGTKLQDLNFRSNRYALFKVGPVLSASYGLGMPSISILLHELIKLMYHSGVKDPLIFKLGTCGGLGVEPGSVIVTTEVLNGQLKPVHRMGILGKLVERPTVLDDGLVHEIIQLQEASDNFQIFSGKTISTDDFYEGQARLDGAFCNFNEDEKFRFLHHVQELGVKNFEMEAAALAAICKHVGIRAAVICVTLLDKLKEDKIRQSTKTEKEFHDRPMLVVARYIRKYIKSHPEIMDKITKSNTAIIRSKEDNQRLTLERSFSTVSV